MNIKIPESLFKELEYCNGKPMPLGLTTITVNGPFGNYTVTSVPDKEFCEERIETVLRYKEDPE